MASERDPEMAQPLITAGEPDCADGAWSMPPRRPKPVVTTIPSSSGGNKASTSGPARNAHGHHIHGPDKQSLAASVATLLLTLPALVGSWCWPLLLAGFMGITATAGAKAFSHTFSLALTLTILTNLTQYTYWKSAYKVGGSLWSRQGPTFLLALATPLLLADLVRHCLQDADIWPAPGSAMYRDDCESVRGINGLLCLTLVGWIFSIFCTYSGFILMIVSVIWSANLSEKLRHAWSQVFSGQGQQEPEYELWRYGGAYPDVNSPPSHTINLPEETLAETDGSGSTHVMLHMFQIRKRRPSDHNLTNQSRARVRAGGSATVLPDSPSHSFAGAGKTDGSGSGAVKLKDGRPTRYNIQVTTK